MPARRQARFLLVSLLIVAALAGALILPYANTLTLAVVIGIVFSPLATRIRRKVRSESLAAMLTLLIALVLVITPLAFFGFQAGREAFGLYERLTRDQGLGTLTSISLQHLVAVLPPAVRSLVPSTIDLDPILRSAGSWIVARAGSLFGILTSFALELFLLIVGTYYVIKDGKRFVDYLVGIAPLDSSYDRKLFTKLHASVISVVRGALVIAVAQGVAAGVGFFVFGVPNAALWGVATMVAALIPILGTALTLVPAVIYLALVGQPMLAVLLAIWGLFIVGLVDNFFRGQLMKRGMDIHPFLILLSVLGGLEFFGPIGFISGPLLLSVLAALLDIYASSRERLDAPATLEP